MLSENSFRSGSPTEKGDCGPAIYLENVEEGVISSTSFRDLRTPAGVVAGDARGALIRLRSVLGTEGHHTVISSCVMSSIETGYGIWLDRNHFNFVGGNVLDRFDQCHAAIKANNGPVLGVVGNVMSRISSPDSNGRPLSGTAVVLLEEIDNFSMAGNVMRDIFMEDFLKVAPGSSTDIHVDPEQVFHRRP